jgi:hypothetical protein
LLSLAPQRQLNGAIASDFSALSLDAAVLPALKGAVLADARHAAVMTLALWLSAWAREVESVQLAAQFLQTPTTMVMSLCKIDCLPRLSHLRMTPDQFVSVTVP